jgi:hypothetical protein
MRVDWPDCSGRAPQLHRARQHGVTVISPDAGGQAFANGLRTTVRAEMHQPSVCAGTEGYRVTEANIRVLESA